jgi:hypothetical protein
MKSHPVEAELFYADRHTDGWMDRHMTKLTVAFRNFASVPKTGTNDVKITQQGS